MSNRKVVCDGDVCRIGAGTLMNLPAPSDDHWTLFGATWCPPCKKVKVILNKLSLTFDFVDIDKYENSREQLVKMCGKKTIPQVYMNGNHIGGYTETKQYLGM